MIMPRAHNKPVPAITGIPRYNHPICLIFSVPEMKIKEHAAAGGWMYPAASRMWDLRFRV
jgi:hypothetical protein